MQSYRFVLFVIAAGFLLNPVLQAHTHPCGCKHTHLTGNDSRGLHTTCDIPNQQCTYNGKTGKCKTVSVSLGLTATSACICEVDDPGKSGQLRCQATGPVAVPGITTFSIVPSAPENSARIYFNDEQAPLCGEYLDVPEAAGSFTIWAELNPYNPMMVKWEVLEVDVAIPSFMFCGQPTGLNTLVLDPNGLRWGEGDVMSSEFEGGFSLIMTNDLYSETPLKEELYTVGSLNVITGELLLSYLGHLSIPTCANYAEIEGDINGDCAVDINDFSLLATHWLESEPL